jgi:acyl-CoA thioesterase-2
LVILIILVHGEDLSWFFYIVPYLYFIYSRHNLKKTSTNPYSLENQSFPENEKPMNSDKTPKSLPSAATEQTPKTALGKLVETLELERLEQNLFRGRSPDDGWQRVFGGQVVGQALRAATHTVEARFAHSLHAYFMRPGDPRIPIIYEVERTREGRSFATRRVIAIQHGKPIFTMSCSFHHDEPGYAHQIDMPKVPDPDELPSESELKNQLLDKMPEPIREYWKRERAIEVRPVDFSRYISPQKAPPIQHAWFRPTGALPNNRDKDLPLHQCAIAFATDISLLDTTLIPHARTVFDPRLALASIDHALWFHKPAFFDDWMLYSTDSPVTSGARGFTRGTLFTRQGELVASAAQEGLIRDLEDRT